MSSKCYLGSAPDRGVTVAAPAAGGLMTKAIWTGACSSIIVGAAVAAMAQPPTPQENTTGSTDQKIVVTGCLKAAPSAGPDAAATAGTTGTVATGTTGTTGTTAAARPTDTADAKFV